MKKKIYNKYDKSKIGTLPRVLFEGRIVVVLTETEAEKAVRYLLSQPILGVDTETRPSFKKGTVHQVSLLQVSSHDVCFLFRLNQLGMSPSVKRLLEDTKVPKMYANFFGQRISKREQFTNWEADILSDKQKGYAATDAWSCIMLYEELQRLEQTGDYELIKVDDNETSTAA